MTLILEKLRLDYFIDSMRDPAYLQPDAAMPRLDFTDLQYREAEEWAQRVQRLMLQRKVLPVHLYYQMQKRP